MTRSLEGVGDICGLTKEGAMDEVGLEGLSTRVISLSTGLAKRGGGGGDNPSMRFLT